MDALIEDLLSFGKVCVVDVPNSFINLNTVVSAVLRKCQVHIESTSAVIEVRRPLPTVWANEWALEQALTQLVSNALKFGRPGVPPRILIYAELRARVARLWIEDNGLGIPAEYRERVFQIFERLEPDSGSTGMGLAIVRKAVERMEGRVGVESSPGSGSRFWLEVSRGP